MRTPFSLFKRSVVFKITLVIVLLTLSSMAIHAYLLFRQFRELSQSKKADQISLAQVTATILSDIAIEADYSRMMDVLSNLKEKGEEHKLEYGIIMDNKGYVYAHTDDRFLGKNLEDEKTRLLMAHLNQLERDKIFIHEYKEEGRPPLREISIPITMGGDIYIHVLRLGFSLRAIEEFRRHVFLQTITIGLISLLVVLFLYRYIRRSVLNPITELTRNALEVQEGKTDQIIPIHTGDELEKLSQAFSSMLQNLKKKQSQLLQSHKELAEARVFSAIGEGAFSIAHRIGNLMNPVESWLKNIEAQHQVRENLEKIYRQIYLIKEYISRAKSIDPGVPHFEFYSIPNLINLALERNPPPQGIKVEKNFSTVREIKVDPSQMEDVFSNLIVNAYEAMEQKGGTLRVDVYEEEGSLYIKFSDNGPGVQGNREEIFNPFYTTKKEGTGFGLFRARRVLGAHNGTIYVEDNQGKGATFVIKFPLSSGGP